MNEEGLKQPDFEVSENTIKIVLPVFEKNLNLTEDERKIYKLLSRTMLKSISEIAPYATFGKSKTTQLLKEMDKKVMLLMSATDRGMMNLINTVSESQLNAEENFKLRAIEYIQSILVSQESKYKGIR